VNGAGLSTSLEFYRVTSTMVVARAVHFTDSPTTSLPHHFTTSPPFPGTRLAIAEVP